MREPFKGTDSCGLDLDADCIRLVNNLLAKAEFTENVEELSDSLKDYFSQTNAGSQVMSHDQLALLVELFTKASFTNAALPTAEKVIKIIAAALNSFYEGE